MWRILTQLRCRESNLFSDFLSHQSVHCGPRIEIEKKSLLFQTKPGGTAQQSLRVTNNGSTVIYYLWERVPRETVGVSANQVLIFL